MKKLLNLLFPKKKELKTIDVSSLFSPHHRPETPVPHKPIIHT